MTRSAEMARTLTTTSVLCALLLLLLSTSLPSALASDSASLGSVSRTKNFDYFMFVRQWAGSLCEKKSCDNVHVNSFRFTIHGLWPNYGDGTWPQFCKSSYKFEEEDIDDILSELDYEWPSVVKNNEQFWQHEWDRHGTCALEILPSEHRYFKTTLQLHKEYNIAEALEAKDIVPSAHKKYKLRKIQRAIRSEFGVDAKVHCNPNGELTEVWMCVSRDLEPVDCSTVQDGPDDGFNQCPGKVLIPPMRHSKAKQQEDGAVATTVADLLNQAVEDPKASVQTTEEEDEVDGDDDEEEDEDHDHDHDGDDDDDDEDEDHDHDHDHDHDGDDDDDDEDDEDDDDDDDDEDDDDDDDEDHEGDEDYDDDDSEQSLGRRGAPCPKHAHGQHHLLHAAQRLAHRLAHHPELLVMAAAALLGALIVGVLAMGAVRLARKQASQEERLAPLLN